MPGSRWTVREGAGLDGFSFFRGRHVLALGKELSMVPHVHARMHEAPMPS